MVDIVVCLLVHIAIPALDLGLSVVPRVSGIIHNTFWYWAKRHRRHGHCKDFSDTQFRIKFTMQETEGSHCSSEYFSFTRVFCVGVIFSGLISHPAFLESEDRFFFSSRVAKIRLHNTWTFIAEIHIVNINWSTSQSPDSSGRILGILISQTLDK